MNGFFELPSVPEGTWTVAVSKAGFVTLRSGQRHPAEAVTATTVRSGQTVTIRIALMRAGAVGGTVVDDLGEPISGVQVRALRARRVRGMLRLEPTIGGVSTDDRGSFRLHGLAPGDYYVAPIVATRPQTIRRHRRPSLAPVERTHGHLRRALPEPFITAPAPLAFQSSRERSDTISPSLRSACVSILAFLLSVS